MEDLILPETSMYSFFINSDSNLTQTQFLASILTQALIQTLILTLKKAKEILTIDNFLFLSYFP